VRWERGGVLFVGLNLPGNQKPWERDPAEEAEYRRLLRADVEWIREGFREAGRRGFRGVMVLFQANPIFDRSSLPENAKKRLTDYDPILKALREEAASFHKPVALVHGDLHYFEIDMPLRDSTSTKVVANFTRVQVFGDPNAHWVKGTVDPADPQVFRFEAMIVPETP
jgi:hypothetical protein